MAGTDLYDTELRDQPWRLQEEEAGLGVVCSQTFSATVQAEEGIQKTFCCYWRVSRRIFSYIYIYTQTFNPLSGILPLPLFMFCINKLKASFCCDEFYWLECEFQAMICRVSRALLSRFGKLKPNVSWVETLWTFCCDFGYFCDCEIIASEMVFVNTLLTAL